MPRVEWPLLRSRPRIEIVLTRITDGQAQLRRMLADTGAGTSPSRFELLLREIDCITCGGLLMQSVMLGGAYTGRFPTYLIRVQIPGLAVSRDVRAAAVSTPPDGFDGIACFAFLNQFTLGNFGDRSQFGLEM